MKMFSVPDIRDDNALVFAGKKMPDIEAPAGRGWSFSVAGRKLFVSLLKRGEKARMTRHTNGHFAYALFLPSYRPAVSSSLFGDAYWAVAQGGLVLAHVDHVEALEAYARSAQRYDYVARLLDEKRAREKEGKALRQERDRLLASIRERDRFVAEAEKARKKREAALVMLEATTAPAKKRELMERLRKYRAAEEAAAGVDLDALERDKHRAVALGKRIKEASLSNTEIFERAGVTAGEEAGAFLPLGLYGDEWAVFRKAPLPYRYTVEEAAERGRTLRWFLEAGPEGRSVEGFDSHAGARKGKLSLSAAPAELEAIVAAGDLTAPPDVFESGTSAEIQPPLMPPTSANIVNMLFSGVLNGRLETDEGEVLVKGSITKEWQMEGRRRIQAFQQTLYVFHLDDYTVEVERI